MTCGGIPLLGWGQLMGGFTHWIGAGGLDLCDWCPLPIPAFYKHYPGGGGGGGRLFKTGRGILSTCLPIACKIIYDEEENG